MFDVYRLAVSIDSGLECTNEIVGTKPCKILFTFWTKEQERLGAGSVGCELIIPGEGGQTFKCPEKLVIE